MAKKKTKTTNEVTSNIQPVRAVDEISTETIPEFEDEYDIEDLEDSDDLDDIVPYDNSRETYDYNFTREDEERVIPELHLDSVQQQSDIIGYDSIKLKLSLTYANEVGFSVARENFFRTSKPHIPATNLYANVSYKKGTKGIRR